MSVFIWDEYFMLCQAVYGCLWLTFPSISVFISLNLSLSLCALDSHEILFFFNEGMEENVHLNILALIVSQFTETYQPQRITKRFNQKLQNFLWWTNYICWLYKIEQHKALKISWQLRVFADTHKDVEVYHDLKKLVCVSVHESEEAQSNEIHI